MQVDKTIYDTSETAFAVDRNGKIVAWNEAAKFALGYTVSEALGQQCWELLSGKDIFGNPYCSASCPLHTMAFNDEMANRFQVDFETAKHTCKRFLVSLLTLSAGVEGKIMVHLCHLVSASDVNGPTARTQYKTLTLREVIALTHLHRGESVMQIAASMNISDSTVRNHIQHVLQKLNVHTRLQAVTLGRKLGLI